jgi:hypothetical protein
MCSTLSTLQCYCENKIFCFYTIALQNNSVLKRKAKRKLMPQIHILLPNARLCFSIYVWFHIQWLFSSHPVHYFLNEQIKQKADVLLWLSRRLVCCSDKLCRRVASLEYSEVSGYRAWGFFSLWRGNVCLLSGGQRRKHMWKKVSQFQKLQS